MGDVISDDVVLVCYCLSYCLGFCVDVVDLSDCPGSGNVCSTTSRWMQSLHDIIILWLSFSATSAVVFIVLPLWLMLSATCPIIFILSPLALMMFAFLAPCTGSPCALAMLPLRIVVVDPVSARA